MIELVAKKFQMENTEDVASLDSNLATHTKETGDIESAEKLQDVITLSCTKPFKILGKVKSMITQKLVQWWTEELIIKRKKLKRPKKTTRERKMS